MKAKEALSAGSDLRERDARRTEQSRGAGNAEGRREDQRCQPTVAFAMQ